MNTKKVVFNKLFSTEAKEAQKLSKQRKISLSLVEKMESYLDSMNDEILDAGVNVEDSIAFIKYIESQLQAGDEILQNLNLGLKSLMSYEPQVSSLLEEYRSAADELGINPEDNAVYSELFNSLEGSSNSEYTLLEMIDMTEKAISDLQQYLD